MSNRTESFTLYPNNDKLSRLLAGEASSRDSPEKRVFKLQVTIHWWVPTSQKKSEIK